MVGAALLNGHIEVEQKLTITLWLALLLLFNLTIHFTFHLKVPGVKYHTQNDSSKRPTLVTELYCVIYG